MLVRLSIHLALFACAHRFYQWPEEGEICCIKSDSLERLIDSIKYINSACFLIENNRIKVKIAKANRVPANGVNISS